MKQVEIARQLGGKAMKMKLSQNKIAQQLGISKSYLSMILSGQRKPTQELADKLCSLGLFTTEAKLCLEGRHSTAELLPQKLTFP